MNMKNKIQSDVRRGSGDVAESEDGRDDGDDKEDQRPAENTNKHPPIQLARIRGDAPLQRFPSFAGSAPSGFRASWPAAVGTTSLMVS